MSPPSMPSEPAAPSPAGADPDGSGVGERADPLDSVLRPDAARPGRSRREPDEPDLTRGPAGGAVRDALVERLVDRGWPPPLAEALLSARVALATVAVLVLAVGVGLWWTASGRAPASAVGGDADGQVAAAAGDPAAGSRLAPDSEPAVVGRGTSVRDGADGGGTTVPPVVNAHAAGAVVVPGLYRLASGARVADLVAAAGGLAADADADRVNLAAPVGDGARVYVPRRGETAVPSVPADGSGGAVPGAPGTPNGSSPGSPAGPVNVNTATVTELDTLPGIGPATAQAIVDHRSRHGPFRTVADLAKVKGIGPAKLAQLEPLVSV
jgi:competence protein ComEA